MARKTKKGYKRRQTAKQRAASLRNLKKARAAQKRTVGTRSKSARRSKTRRSTTARRQAQRAAARGRTKVGMPAAVNKRLSSASKKIAKAGDVAARKIKRAGDSAARKINKAKSAVNKRSRGGTKKKMYKRGGKKKGVTRAVTAKNGRKMYFVNGKLTTEAKYRRAKGLKSKAASKPRKKAAKRSKRKATKRTAKTRVVNTKNGKRYMVNGKFATEAAYRRAKGLKSKKAAKSRRKSTSKRAGWKKPGAKSPKKPKRAPTSKSRPRYDHSKPWRKGRRKPGIYPVMGKTPHWRAYSNPGVKIMPNGTILDPKTRKFVSPRSARGRQLMKSGGGSSWLPNPLSNIAELPGASIAMEAVKSAAAVGVGFFSARTLANYAAGSTMVPASVQPYAPFLAQILTGVLGYVVTERIDRVRPYQPEFLAGVALSAIEALVNRFAPASIQSHLAVPPPGLGMDYGSYRRALSGAEGLDEGWNDFYPGDAAVLQGMNDYILEEDLDPAFDMGGGMGDYVSVDELDPEFDFAGGMGGVDDIVMDQIESDRGMGGYVLPENLPSDLDVGLDDYVTTEDLDPVFDLSGVDEITDRARAQIAMGDDQPIISGIYGPPMASGMFAPEGVAELQRCQSLARTAVKAAKATGAPPSGAAAEAYRALRKAGKTAGDAKAQALAAVKAEFARGGSAHIPQPIAPIMPEVHDTEDHSGGFHQGMFADPMFATGFED